MEAGRGWRRAGGIVRGPGRGGRRREERQHILRVSTDRTMATALLRDDLDSGIWVGTQGQTPPLLAREGSGGHGRRAVTTETPARTPGQLEPEQPLQRAPHAPSPAPAWRGFSASLAPWPHPQALPEPGDSDSKSIHRESRSQRPWGPSPGS